MAGGASRGGQRLDDPARLEALARSELMDSGPEEVFDRLTRVAARVLGTPLAFLTLLDEHRQFFKSRFGLDEDAVPLAAANSYCQYVVNDAAPFVVEDLRGEDRITDPSGLLENGLLAYCGVPLTDSGGNTLGTLCTIDESPHRWSDDDVELLTELAAGAVAEIELRIANRELHARDRERRAVLDGMHEAFAGCDAAGTIVQWNRAAERMLGFSEAEVAGTSVIDLLVPGDQRERARQILAGTRERTDGLQIETFVRHRSGTAVHVELSLSVVELPGGRRINMICRDVGELRATQRQEAHLATIVAAADEAIGTVDLHGRVTAWNRACERIYGYRAEEVLGRPFPAVEIAGPDPEIGLSMAARAMSGESVSAEAAPRRRKDGTIAYLDINLTPLRDADDAIVGVTAIARDVTEQRHLRAELVNAVALLDESQASAHVGSWSLEPESGLTRWSREQFALHGLTPRDEAPSEQEFLASVHPDDRPKVLRPLGVLDEEDSVHQDEYRVVLPSGAVRTLASRIELLAPDPARGRPRRLSGTTWDITVEREARAAQRATEQRHRRLLATLPDAMVILYDTELRLELIQGGLVAELGIDPVALEGRRLHDLITNDKYRSLPELVGRALAGESTAIDLDMRAEPGSPLDRIFQIESAPYYGEDGSIVGAFTVWRDVTQRILHEEQNRMLATMVQQSSDAIEAKNLDGVVTEWSGAAELLYGYSRAEAVGQAIGELILPPDRRQEEVDAVARARAGESTQVDTVRRHKDGHLVHVSLSQSPIYNADGEVVGVAVIARDIAERIRHEQARRAIAEQLRITVEHAPIGVAVIDLDDGANGKLLSVNRAFTRLLSDPDPAGAGVTLASMIHPDDAAALRADLALLASDGLTRIEMEVRCLHTDGQVSWLLLTGSAVPAADDAPRQAIVHALDIGERKRFEGQLQHLADHDPLTGLFNRRRFEQELTRTVSFVDRYATPSALFLIDLDGFKAVNDTMGHSYGDEILTRVAGALKSTMRETDVIGRLGGDEFAVIVNSVGASEAQLVAEKVLIAIRQHGVVVSEHHRAAVSASIGVTLLDHEAHLGSEALLARADAAMYAAKQDGRDRVAFTDDDAGTGTVTSQQSWLTRLREALDQNRFELYAQPIRGICADTDDCYELLLRMRGEDGELIMPASFLYNAERFDLIQEIDRWVFGQSLQLLRRHAAAGSDVCLSVNMSARTLGDPALLDDLGELLAACPIPRDRLIVEVTETAAIVNIDRAREIARALRSMGIRFALDDFGAGFASFYYLKHLEFDFVKIDGEFIKGLAHNATDQLVIRSVVDLARGLGAQTIAEFVGDEESVRRLHELGVDYGQGYHLGRPEPIADILPISATLEG